MDNQTCPRCGSDYVYAVIVISGDQETRSSECGDCGKQFISIEATGNEGERAHPAPCGYPEYLCCCPGSLLDQIRKSG